MALLDPTVALLQSRTFTADEVTSAIGCTPDSFNHYMRRIKPKLCSVSGGQGRARHFTLLDAYQLALLNELTDLTGKANWAARALDRFLFEDYEYDERGPLEHMQRGEPTSRKLAGRERANETIRHRVCADITEAPELYWTRDASAYTQRWVIVADRYLVENGEFRFVACTIDDVARALHHTTKALVLNATGVLIGVDHRLNKIAALARHAKESSRA